MPDRWTKKDWELAHKQLVGEAERLRSERDFYKAQCDVSTYVERTDALMRERDEARAFGTLHMDRATRLETERDEARAIAEANRLSIEGLVDGTGEMQSEIDRLRALLREWREIDPLSWVPSEDLLDRTDAALEGRDG